MAKKASTRSPKTRTGRRRATDRELIDTGRDKRFMRRSSSGQFQESDDVGRSLGKDRRRKAKHVVRSGQGDRGDQARR